MSPFRLVLQASAIVAALAGVAGPAAAQTIQPSAGAIDGIVVDAETGEPLVATAVRVIEVHRTETVRADGRFVFDRLRPGRYTIVADRIGYRSETVPVDVVAGETVQLRVALNVAAVHLEQLVVTGAISARSARDLLSAGSVVTGAQLDRQLGGTVAATVQGEPGVAMSAIGPATARPVIRGLGGDRILILEDGQRPGDLSSTSGDHAVAVEPLTASQVEVVRGPLSLLYGSSAMGGVVNIVREEIPAAVPDHIHGVLVSQVSSVNRGGAIGGHSSVGVGSFALRGEASARTSGDVRTPLGSMSNTDARTFNLSAGLAHVGDWGHAGAAYRFYSNDYGIPGGFVGGHEGGVDIEMRRHNVRGEVELHPRANGLLSDVKATASFTDYHHVELEGNGFVGTRFDQQQVAGDIIARHDQRGIIAQGAVGIRAQYRDIRTGGSLRTPSTDDISLAGFVVEEIGTGPLRLQAGARYDWARYRPREAATITIGGVAVPVRERTFGSMSGALGLLYVVREDLRFGASVSRAYRTPDFNELYSDGPHLAANSYDVGDPELSQETGIGVDVFARVTGSRLRAEVAAFRNHLSDYIFPSSRGRVESGPQRGRPRLQFTNQDAEFTGVEGELEWNPLGRWVVHGTASYVRAEFTQPRDSIALFENGDTTFIAASRYPPLIPPFNGRAGVRYESPRYFAGADLRWAARQERLGDFEEETAAYAVGDLHAGVRILVGSQFHTLTLRVENPFDTEYREHLSRTKAIMPEPGRNISLLYRLSF